MSKVDDETIKEFLEHYAGTSIPAPEQYPKRFKFMIETFLYHKSRKEVENGNK